MNKYLKAKSCEQEKVWNGKAPLLADEARKWMTLKTRENRKFAMDERGQK